MKAAFKKLLLEGKGTDFTIKTQNGDVHAHKAILTAASPVFDKMINSPHFLEAKSSTVEISDTTKETIQEFLVFLYTRDLHECDSLSSADAPTSLLLEVMRLSHKYSLHEVEDTAQAFTAFIKDRCVLTEDNVVEIFQLSRWIHFDKLREMCVEYLEPIIDKVVHKDSFASLCGKDTSLAPDLFCDLCELWSRREAQIRSDWTQDHKRLKTEVERAMGEVQELLPSNWSYTHSWSNVRASANSRSEMAVLAAAELEYERLKCMVAALKQKFTEHERRMKQLL